MSCELTLNSRFYQVIVGVTRDGNGNIIMSNTDTQIIMPDANILQDSLSVTNGVEIPRYDASLNQQYYAINYSNYTVIFLQPFDDEQVLIFKYLYLT